MQPRRLAVVLSTTVVTGLLVTLSIAIGSGMSAGAGAPRLADAKSSGQAPSIASSAAALPTGGSEPAKIKPLTPTLVALAPVGPAPAGAVLNEAGSAQAAAVPVLPAEPPPGGSCTALTDWGTRGEMLKAARIQAGDKAHAYAYPATPITITGAGDYVFEFGPLDPGRFVDFPPPVSSTVPPQGISVDLPWDFRSYISYQPTVNTIATTITKANGQRYLRMPMTITPAGGRTTVRPCTNLVAWLQ